MGYRNTMHKCFTSSYRFYYPNKKKPQSLNEKCLSLPWLEVLSTSGRYCTCWNFWCLKAVASPTSRCEEISLFCRMLEKPQSSLKVDSQFCYLKKWEIPPIFIAWVIGLKVLGKVFKYHEPPCLPIYSLLLALLQNLISFINFSTFMFSNCWIKKISLCKKTSKRKGEVSNDSALQKKLF
jgi:hypothetical protein